MTFNQWQPTVFYNELSAKEWDEKYADIEYNELYARDKFIISEKMIKDANELLKKNPGKNVQILTTDFLWGPNDEYCYFKRYGIYLK